MSDYNNSSDFGMEQRHSSEESAAVENINAHDSEIFTQQKPESDRNTDLSEGVNLSPDQLSEMLHKAYMRGRNENIEARIDADCQAKPQRNVAGELLVKGIAGVAKAIFSPGRRSIWPKRRG